MSNPRTAAIAAKVTYYCSFCGKADYETLCLVAGPNHVFICDECTDMCRDIVGKHRCLREDDAQRIEARSDETPAEAVRPEGQEPDGEADAPKDAPTVEVRP